MELLETYDLKLPELCIYPLEYGVADADMGEEDVRTYNKTVETINELLQYHEGAVHFTLEYGEPYFSHNNDITRQGGNVVDTKLHIWKE